MDLVESIIKERLGDDRTAFVFPSEIAAASWRRRALELTHVKAVRERQFLSWDRFKEECFSLTREERPINSVVRTLYAATLLEENASGTPFLSSIVDPDHAGHSSAYVRALCLILPQLASFRAILERAEARSGGALLDQSLTGDLRLLSDRYERFLSANRLFEPASASIDVSRLDRSYVLFFPEVIEDYAQFREQLASAQLRLVPIPMPTAIPILRFANSVQELRWLFAEILRLLETGESFDEIAITVADLDEWIGALSAEADLRGIPLSFRNGRALADYPEARLFSALQAVEAEGFSPDSLKRLFLNRAFPWRDSETSRRLVRFGIEHRCTRTYREGGRLRDPLREQLSVGDERDLLAFYGAFSSELRRIAGASSFAELRRRITAFTRGRLDTEAWSLESRRVFEFCLDSLGDFVEAERLTVGLKPAAPFALWLAHLDERIYVRRAAASGIAVYPYRVSAGIYAKHHFVVGAHQVATKVEQPLFRFLREDERSLLGVRDVPFTDDFFALYLQSGERTSVSYSREEAGGPRLAPGWFVSRRLVADFEGGDELRGSDPFEAERSVWSGAARPPQRLFPAQKEGVAHLASTGFAERGPDLTHEPLAEGSIRERLIARLVDENGVLRVSPTRLERYFSCPFAYLFGDVLALPEPSFEVDFDDPRLIGSITHTLLRLLFERLKASDGSVLEDAATRHERIVDEVFVDAGWEPVGPPFPAPIWKDLKRRLRDQAERLLAEERKLFAGYEIVALEETYRLREDGLSLDGRIDRVSLHDGKALVVDYKKRNRTRLRDIVGEEGERGTSFQIPFYILLLEESGIPVGQAGYYDVERGRYNPVLEEKEGRREIGGVETKAVLETLRGTIREYASRIQHADFLPPNRASGCDACTFRAVCRMKYSVK